MNTHICEYLRSSLSRNRVIATVSNPTLSEMPRIIEALLKGGIRWIEITLRTGNALELIKLCHQKYPEMNILAGTVIECDQVKQVRDAGAQIAVAPNLSAKVLEVAKAEAMPFVPGVATPSEIGLGIELGYRIFKFFPAEMIGGLPYIKRVYAPYAHKEIEFIPLGGIDQSHMAEYLKEEFVIAVGGSWIVNSDLIKSENWSGIISNARNACLLASVE